MCKILISLIFSVISCNPCDVSCVNSMNSLRTPRELPDTAISKKVTKPEKG